MMVETGDKKFDPNSPLQTIPQPKWATYCKRRRPNFKLHKRVGDAKNACYINNTVTIYEFVDGKWVERYSQEGRRSYDKNKIKWDF